jgi:hypothetical protein
LNLYGSLDSKIPIDYKGLKESVEWLKTVKSRIRSANFQQNYWSKKTP